MQDSERGNHWDATLKENQPQTALSVTLLHWIKPACSTHICIYCTTKRVMNNPSKSLNRPLLHTYCVSTYISHTWNVNLQYIVQKHEVFCIILCFPLQSGEKSVLFITFIILRVLEKWDICVMDSYITMKQWTWFNLLNQSQLQEVCRKNIKQWHYSQPFTICQKTRTNHRRSRLDIIS